MNKRSTHFPPPRSALSSPRADFRELAGNSRATVRELQTFLDQLKGKSPQEMLGVAASSHLVRSLVLSTTLVSAALLIFTAIPYFMVAAAPPESVEPSSLIRAPLPEPPAEVPETPEPEPGPLGTLGVEEELSAPSTRNPLESTGDDFLKDLDE